MPILSGYSWRVETIVSGLTHLLPRSRSPPRLEILEIGSDHYTYFLKSLARTLGSSIGGFFGGIGLESNTYNPHDNEWRNDPSGVIIFL